MQKINSCMWIWLKTLFRLLPTKFKKELLRREYDIPSNKIKTLPFRETLRHVASKLGINYLIRSEKSFASIDSVYINLDKRVAKQLHKLRNQVSSVYCYEYGALETFKAAKKLGVRCIYDLPITYCETTSRLLN